MVYIVDLILFLVLGPANYARGVELMKTVYNVPDLANLLGALSTVERYGVPVTLREDTIQRGLEELKHILDMGTDSRLDLSDEQKTGLKNRNTLFVDFCHQYIMSRTHLV